MFCTECGKELPDNSTFCGYCGTALTPLNYEANTVNGTIDQPADNVHAQKIYNNVPHNVSMQNVSDTQTCPYCMTSINKAAVICPNCRKKIKKNKKLRRIVGIAAAVIVVFFIISSIASTLSPTGSIESAYDKLFADLENGSFHAKDGEYLYSGQGIVDDFTYSFADPGNSYNVYNSFYSISGGDVTRLWNISMKNYDYDIVSVEKDGEKYMVTVELSNKDIYDVFDTAVASFASQFDLSGIGVDDVLGTIVGAREGYLNSGGGLWGAIGAYVGAQNAAGAATADISAYQSGINNGSNAKQIVDLFEEYIEGDNYGTTNTATIRFYATKDDNGNWCIPDIVYVDTSSGQSEKLSYSEIFYDMLGFGY